MGVRGGYQRGSGYRIMCSVQFFKVRRFQNAPQPLHSKSCDFTPFMSFVHTLYYFV